MELTSSPRISFSVDFVDDNDFISISPCCESPKKLDTEREKVPVHNVDFEFLSSNSTGDRMLTADEFFFEGRLLSSWEMQHLEKLNKISLKTKDAEGDHWTETTRRRRSSHSLPSKVGNMCGRNEEGDHWTEEVFSRLEERRSSHALFDFV
uniref:Uncharacterized protein n=1 Tax=Nelumbo nucifera TaxID=4432 RepID=A0A822Z203_NELNU|nr:TPA_asm: hypothetical protein HUJ06_008140 [Nelumbo nucifera]